MYYTKLTLFRQTVYLILIQINSLHAVFFFHAFLWSADIFQNSLFQIILSLSNSLDPDQAQCFSGPDLGPNCKDHQQTTKFAARILKIGVKLLFARVLLALLKKLESESKSWSKIIQIWS